VSWKSVSLATLSAGSASKSSKASFVTNTQAEVPASHLQTLPVGWASLGARSTNSWPAAGEAGRDAPVAIEAPASVWSTHLAVPPSYV